MDFSISKLWEYLIYQLMIFLKFLFNITAIRFHSKVIAKLTYKIQFVILFLKLYQTEQTNNNTMYEQQIFEQDYFGDQLQSIHQVYIKTSYGNIFAHAVGKHGQPLIIIVHGSGPKNSGDQYLYMLHEYLVRISYIEKFFIVSIDCPGYGRSKGSKEAVKTFPLQMFRQILKDLGYSSYFAMLGHSQGGAAIFNAVYQDPRLTQFMLMDRPVCGNIKRFNKFPIPTLLIYDIEDDGHPIWQGKLLFKQLSSSQFHTYRNSRAPYWVPDNIWNLILSFFKKYSSERKSLLTSNFSRPILYHRSQSIKKQRISNPKSLQKSKKKHVSTSKYEQRKKQQQSQKKNLIPIRQIDKSEVYSRVADLQEFENLPTWLNQPKQQQTQQQIKKQQEKMKLQQEKFKKQVKIINLNFQDQKNQIRLDQKSLKEKLRQKQRPRQKSKQKSQKNSQKRILIKQNQQNKYIKQQKKQIKQTKQQKKQVSKSVEVEQGENKCSICHQNYYFPVETNCKHIFCKKCVGQSMLVDQRCALCRTKITKRTLKQQLHQKIISLMQQKQRQRRQKDLFQFQQMLKSIIYIQIGNTSRELVCKKSPFSKTKTKYIWQIYAKQPKNFKFEQVSFNINMGNRDSVPVKVTHAPFVFQSRSTFSFSCQIIIKPKNRDYVPITSIYRIDVQPGNHSKIIALKKKN